MALAITSNFGISAGYAANNMKSSQGQMSKSINRISSGKKAPNPVDDIVSYMKSMKLKSDATGNAKMDSSVQNIAARLNVADSVYSDFTNAVLEMKNLATAYLAAGSSNNDERAQLAGAFSAAKTAASAMAKAQYAGADVFSASVINTLVSMDGTSKYAVAAGTLKSPVSAVSGWANLTISAALTTYNTSLDTLAEKRATLGGYLSALDQISSYLSDMSSTTDAAYSAVNDVDIAHEMTSYVKNNILSQAAQAMISQANQSLAQTINLLQF